MDVDRFPGLGPKRRISGPEEALRLVREVHPGAGAEGSTGAKRTWTVGAGETRTVVAHHWSPTTGRRGGAWWIRIAPTVADGEPW